MTIRRRGLSVRAKLTLSYSGFLMVAWIAFLGLLTVVLGYLPDGPLETAGYERFAPSRADLWRATVPIVALSTMVLAVLGVAGGWWLAGRMLRPLRVLTEAAGRVSEGSLSHRIHLPGPADELRRLADAMDFMLARLQRRFDEQRRFSANASHELRTPLSVGRTMLEVALGEERHDRVLLERLLEMNQRSTAITDGLLRLARTEQDAVTPSGTYADDVDLGVTVDRVLDLHRLEITSSGVGVTARVSATSVTGDSVLLEQMVANLIANGLRHNLRAGGFLTVCVVHSDAPTLRVVNSGAIFDEATATTLVEPFVRGAGRTWNPSAGAGLGLTLVSSIARAHNATLVVRPRGAGGLDITVAFPQPRSR